MAIKMIVCKAPVKNRKRYVPEQPWMNGLSDRQRKAYIANLDHLDPRATRKAPEPKRAGEV